MTKIFKNQSKFELFKSCWGKIEHYCQKKELKEDSLKKYCNIFIDILKEQIRVPENESIVIIDYIIQNSLLSKFCNYCILYEDRCEILVNYLCEIIHIIKHNNNLMNNSQKFIKNLKDLILLFEGNLKNEGINFKNIKIFCFLLNEVVRMLMHWQGLIKSFNIQNRKTEIGIIKNDYIFFTNLLRLLEIDMIIKEFNYKKYIRRSLIVCMCFDEIYNDLEYLNDCGFIIILITKLCNYYEILPEYFDFIQNSSTLEIIINMNKTFNVLTENFVLFNDYVGFLNKICNMFNNHILKEKFKYFFFNKFLIQTVQEKLLNNSTKISRTNFQYILSMLFYVNNNEIIDVIFNFFFGFNEQKTIRKFLCEEKLNEEFKKNENYIDFDLKKNNLDEIPILEDITANYEHKNHKVSILSYLILNNLEKSKDNINIITYELFEIFFNKRPYLMVRKFIKPYSDFIIKKVYQNNKKNFSLEKYPKINKFYELLEYYKKFNFINNDTMTENIESSMHKNYDFYMNNDIDFYSYYFNEKQNVIDNGQQSVNEISIENISNDGDLLLESINLQPNLNNNKENKTNKNIKIKNNNNNNQEINLDEKLFDEMEEIKEEFNNTNFLFMKNIIQKLKNFLNNSNNENIFLTNLVLTIISVPCLKFDNELIECNSILLNNDNSKFSLLTVLKYLVQELFKIIKKDEKKFEKNLNKQIDQIKKSEDKKNKKNIKIKKAGNLSLVNKISEKDEQEIEYTNYIILFEFIKEFIYSITNKNNFEGLVENIYGFYSNLLEDYYQDEEDDVEEINNVDIN